MKRVLVGPRDPTEIFGELVEEVTQQGRREAYRVGPSFGEIQVPAARVHGALNRTTYRTGQRDVVPFGDPDIPGVLFYPSSEDGEPLPAAGFGWPAVVFVHGFGPGELLDPPLFRRWNSYQEQLAEAGFVSLALEFGLAPSSGRVVNGVEWLVEGDGSRIVEVNPGRLALVGHSAGAEVIADRNDVVDVVRPRATIAVGPNPSRVPSLPPRSLTIGSYSEDNGPTHSAYLAAEVPRHLVIFREAGYSHFGYFDGLGARDGGETQRARTYLALRRFVGRYLLSAPVPDDLGLSIDPPGQHGIRNHCFNLGRGDQCAEDLPP